MVVNPSSFFAQCFFIPGQRFSIRTMTWRSMNLQQLPQLLEDRDYRRGTFPCSLRSKTWTADVKPSKIRISHYVHPKIQPVYIGESFTDCRVLNLFICRCCWNGGTVKLQTAEVSCAWMNGELRPMCWIRVLEAAGRWLKKWEPSLTQLYKAEVQMVSLLPSSWFRHI